jgi:hypothetical protein
MPTRTNHLPDPDYAAKSERVFGKPPDAPFLELYVPEEFRSMELLGQVLDAVWRLEREVIWARMAQLLHRDGVKGDLTEFGVYRGSSLQSLIEKFRPLGVIRRFYGFDSFQGLPPGDPEKDHAWFLAGGFQDGSKDAVRRRLQEAFGTIDNVELVEGWYSKTLPTMGDRIKEVAFARIDCDMYSSTVDVLNFLSGRLCDGAILYFDDWTHDASTGETKAFFEFAARETHRYKFERLLTVSDGALAVRVRLHKP